MTIHGTKPGPAFQVSTKMSSANAAIPCINTAVFLQAGQVTPQKLLKQQCEAKS